MVVKRKRLTMITLSLLSLLMLSVAPIYLGSTSAAEEVIEAGDVLKYKVTRFNVDFTPFNEEPENPFEIDDPTILEDSVLYFKILRVQFDEVTFAVGFILGKDAEVQLDKDADWGEEIDPDLLPEYIKLPRGAGVPFFGGEYDLGHPFPMGWDPEELPLLLDPSGDWEAMQDELIDNWEPTSAELTDDALIATWQQALRSDEEGVEKATLEWDRETGILTMGAIKGQQDVDGDMSEIDIEVAFGSKQHIGLPTRAARNEEFEYVLSVLDFDHKGFEEIAGPQAVEGIESTMTEMQGNPVMHLIITDINGLFYEFEVTMFPGHPQFEEGPEMGEGMAFGVGIPFLTPDWDFYTSVWATGNLIIETFTSLVGAVQPTTEMPEFDIGRLLLDMTVAKEDYRYFGFILGEEVDVTDPDTEETIYTQTDGEGWLAYEEDGLFAGFFLTMKGSIETKGAPEGEVDVDIAYEFTVKVDRADIEGGVSEPSKMEEPKFTPPPSLEDLQKEPEATETEPGAFIPGFDMIAAVSALLGLSGIIVRRKRT